MGNNAFFTAEMTPETALAGDTVEITFRLRLTGNFSAKGSRLILDIPATLGASRPTCHNQEEDGYVAVFCSNAGVRYRKRCYNVELLEFIERDSQKTNMDTDGAKRFFVLDFLDGEVRDGDELEIRYGYVRGGMGCGAHITTNVLQKETYAQFDLRYFCDGRRALPDLGHSVKGFPRPVPDQAARLAMRVLPREPAQLRLLRTRRGTRLLVLDRFCNLCRVGTLEGLVRGETEGRFLREGAYLFAGAAPRVESCGLPMQVTPDFSRPEHGYQLFVGDLHTHSMWSNDCCEREKMQVSPAEMFEYARDVSSLDFLAITDHHQPWDAERNRIGEPGWQDLVAAAARYDEPGTFLALTGFEFRDARGDTPVVFARPPAYAAIDDPALADVTALWKRLAELEEDALCIPHLHNRGTLPPGQWIECPCAGMEPVMDIYSCHGSYEWPDAQERGLPEVKRTRTDRFTRWFLQNGFHYGSTCNSDDHMGHPGSNGLTVILAEKLTAGALFAALRARRCYGTTNARIRLWFAANGAVMGSILPLCRHKVFEISVEGEQPFKAVDLVRNGEIVRRFVPGSPVFRQQIELEEDGPSNWYLRAVQRDNHLAYSSPIWFE